MTKMAYRLPAVLVLAALVATLPAPAATYVFRIDQPFFVGDASFPAGEVELRPIADHHFLAVTFNGKNVGVLVVQRTGFRPMGAAPELVLERDERGRYHLVDIRFASNASILHEDMHVEIAAVARPVGPA